MITDVNEYTDFLCRNKMSPSQFYLCYLLYADVRIRMGDGKMMLPHQGSVIANIYKYTKKVGYWKEEEVQDLIDRGYLEEETKPPNKSEGFIPDYYKVTDKFCSEVFIKPERFDEIWELYPDFVDNFTNPNGPKVKLKVADIDELRGIYKRYVTNKTDHDKVKAALIWAVENNELQLGIRNFIVSRHWESLWKIMNEKKAESNMISI